MGKRCPNGNVYCPNRQNQQNIPCLQKTKGSFFFLTNSTPQNLSGSQFGIYNFYTPDPRLLVNGFLRELKDRAWTNGQWLSCSDSSPAKLQAHHYRTTAGIGPSGWAKMEALIGYLWPQLPNRNAETLYTDWKLCYYLCGNMSRHITNPFLSMNALRSLLTEIPLQPCTIFYLIFIM